MITKENILDCYAFLRKNNNSIPDDVLDFVLNASIEKLENINKETDIGIWGTLK